MITASFSNGRKVRAIILDQPFWMVNGLVECADCAWRTVITSSSPNRIAEDIERFAETHHCEAK